MTPPSSLTVEQLSPSDWARLEHEWDVLQRQTAPRIPFTSPTWMFHWWTHFRRRGPYFWDEFYCHAVRDVEGRLIAVAPLMRTCFPSAGLRLLRIVQFFGTDPSLTEIRGVICRAEDQRRVVQALASHFLKRRREWDVFRWSGLRSPGPAYGIEANGKHPIQEQQLPDYIIDLPDSWETLKARVSSNMRKNVRKAYEFLERDGIEFQARVVEGGDELQPALDRFFSLHEARSAMAGMVRHPNKFARRRAQAFFRTYAEDIARRGQLRIFQLEIGSHIIASRVSFLLDSSLYLYFAGYDPQWRRYSVMTLLMCEIMKWAIDAGIQDLNLSTGADQSKLRWKPAEIVFHTAVQVAPTRRSQLAFGVFRAYDALSRRRDMLRAVRLVPFQKRT